MSRAIPALLLAAATTFATVPVTFTSGSPAKAADVNANFNSLDSAIQKKADASAVSVLQIALTAKADISIKDSLKARVDTGSFSALKAKEAGDVATLNTGLAAKADKSDLGALQAKEKADSATLAVNTASGLTMASLIGIRDTLGSKVDTSALRQLRDTVRTKVDTNWVNKKITTSQSTVLVAVNNLNDVTNPAAARSNLGLKSLATSDSIAWSNVSKIGAKASAIGALDPATAANQYIRKDTSLTVTGGLGTTLITGAGINVNRRLAYFATALDTQAIVLQSNSMLFRDQSNTLNLMTLNRNASNTGSLYVSGSITTGAGSTVPDYVFEPGYKLTSLSDVETYTKANKHLPEVPSASEIEKGGLDLAQMNLVLLKKVEELTLHAIEQQKEIADLKTSVQELKSR